MKMLVVFSFIFGFSFTAIAGDMAGHGHHSHGKVIITDETNIPTVSVKAERDAMSGWNINVETENFRFAPENVNRVNQSGEGHAHIYVDGKKVARLYSHWFHLGDLGPGKHMIKVTLNSNKHDKIIVDGGAVETMIEVIE